MCPVCLSALYVSDLDVCFTDTQLASSMKKGKLSYCNSGIQSSPVCLRYITVASLRSPTYSAQATRLRHAINHSTCSTPSPFRCSDYMTTPIIYCYIFRPPGKWFWTILHATSSLPARWTPLVERKPDSKESGI